MHPIFSETGKVPHPVLGNLDNDPFYVVRADGVDQKCELSA